jgi:hypothetical protein
MEDIIQDNFLKQLVVNLFFIVEEYGATFRTSDGLTDSKAFG